MPKRGENIRKRKDGRWEGRILVEQAGKQKYKSVYANSYYEVKTKVKNFETTIPPKEKTAQNIDFESVCVQWLKENEIKNKQSTCARYKYIIEKYIFQNIKSVNITELKKEDINTLTRNLMYQNELSPKTVQDILNVLFQIIRFAENQNYIDGFNFSVTKPKLQKNDLQVLTPDEQEKLVIYLKANKNYESMGILLSLFLGLRLGEICALKWSDIDIQRKTISINKTMQRIINKDKNENGKTKIVIDTPKSQKSIRKIPIPEFLVSDLIDLSLNCSMNAYFLTGSINKFTEPRLFQYKFKKYVKESGINDINFHALRHTFATRAVEQNFDVKSLSEILGHSTVGFTLDRYVHPSFELKKQSIEKLVACY